MLYFVDSHIHLSDRIYDEHLKLMVDTINNSKIQVYSVSVNLQSSARNIEIKQKYFFNSELFKIFVGIHPEYATLNRLESFNDFLSSNIENIHGIGEIGLDPTYTHNNDSNTIDTQKIVFNQMLNIAEKNRKPISIHSRKSLKDVMDVLPSYQIKKAVFHWYDGSKKNLRKINDLGYYVSFGPYILYSEDKKILLKETDPSLLLLETDGPVSYKRCFENVITSPTFIISIINFISTLLHKKFSDIMETIFKNSVNFLNYT
ncbi:MAG: TatD family hydrolase [Nitrosopumilus sp.]|nr:TatD family hydrolase [Nitrosopumilus sp.]